MSQAPRLAIVSSREPPYSHTFVRTHVRYLPGLVGFVPGLSSLCESESEAVSSLIHERWKKYLISNEVDVVLAEFGPIAAMAIKMCAQIKVPLIAHFHGYDASRFEVLKKHQFDYLELFSKAAGIVAVSTSMCSRLLAMGAPGHKLFHIPYGVDLGLFYPSEKSAASSRFLAVGRFVEKKCPEKTLRAFALVVAQRPEARLTMIGDGPLLPSCRELAHDLGIADHVEFRTPCDSRTVAMAMRDSFAFVQHSDVASDGDREGLPVAILEAGASGLPVVSTFHEGISDAVVDGVTGLLVPPGDFRTMGEAMGALLSDRSRAQDMGRAARVRVEQHYSLPKHIDSLTRLLHSHARRKTC